MATVALAAHVEQFGRSGYKRDFSQITNVGAPPVRGRDALTVPTVTVGGSGPIPGTSAKPDQRVNVRVPVARACGQPLVPGQVAFVSRGVGIAKASSGRELAPAFAGTHALGLEHLNELLDAPQHHVVANAAVAGRPNSLFVSKVARSLFGADGHSRLRALAFDQDAFFVRTKRPNHPLRQYALDGVVCTPSDDPGFGTSVGYCNVAVKGPAPVLTHRTLHDKMRAVAVAPLPQTRVVPDNFFLRPVDVLAKVYVVLVAILVDAGASKWKFRYELVSSSNVHTSHGFPRFTDTIAENAFGQKGDKPLEQATIDAKKRVVLRVHELGRVVDTNFGDRKAPSLVVSVNIRPFEGARLDVVQAKKGGSTESVVVSQPLAVHNSFLGRSEAHGGLEPVREARDARLRAIRSPVRKDLVSRVRAGGGGKGVLMRLLTSTGVKTGDSAVAKELKDVLKVLTDLKRENADQAKQIVGLVQKTLGEDHMVSIADKVIEKFDEKAAAAAAAPAAVAPGGPAPRNEAFYDLVDELTEYMLEELGTVDEAPDDGGIDDVEDLEEYLLGREVKGKILASSGKLVDVITTPEAYEAAAKRASFGYDLVRGTKLKLDEVSNEIDQVRLGAELARAEKSQLEILIKRVFNELPENAPQEAKDDMESALRALKTIAQPSVVSGDI